jgi:hypothetical protein
MDTSWSPPYGRASLPEADPLGATLGPFAIVSGDDPPRPPRQSAGRGDRRYPAGDELHGTYFKPQGTSHLIARPNWTDDPDASTELGAFLEQAWKLANEKARELGWIG